MPILTGLMRLGNDAIIRYLGDGTAVANLSLAYNYGKKAADGKRPTQWLSATLWGERATKLAPYLLKGGLINVVLEDVHLETYEKRDQGGTGTALKGRVSSLEFASSKQDGAPAQARPATTGADYKAGKEGYSKPAASKPSSGNDPGGFSEMSDDIPFNRITDREAMSS